VSVGFNARYLVKCWRCAAGQHRLRLTDEVGPGVVRGSRDPTYTYGCMRRELLNTCSHGGPSAMV
jgi:hypothetical protein